MEPRIVGPGFHRVVAVTHRHLPTVFTGSSYSWLTMGFITGLTDISTMELLLEDLRTLSLSQAGALELQLEPTDIDAMVADLAATYHSVEPPISVGVVGSVDQRMDLDPVRVRQVLNNLLTNASTACGRGLRPMRRNSS